jgi:anti-sigma B factor antagonist
VSISNSAIDPPFSVVSQRSGQLLHIEACGNLEADTHRILLEALLLHVGTATDVRLDLSGIEFIDSSGLRGLLTARKVFHDTGVRFALLAPSPAVTRLFELVGGQALFRVVDAG